VQTYNPSTQEAEAGGSQVKGHPRLHSKTLSRTKTNMVYVSFSYTHSYRNTIGDFGERNTGKLCVV
jgi:hypothetical protein